MPQKSAFCRKRVSFETSKVSVLEKKRVFFSVKKSVERGSFLFWRTIIRPPFCV